MLQKTSLAGYWLTDWLTVSRQAAGTYFCVSICSKRLHLANTTKLVRNFKSIHVNSNNNISYLLNDKCQWHLSQICIFWCQLVVWWLLSENVKNVCENHLLVREKSSYFQLKISYLTYVSSCAMLYLKLSMMSGIKLICHFLQGSFTEDYH